MGSGMKFVFICLVSNTVHEGQQGKARCDRMDGRVLCRALVSLGMKSLILLLMIDILWDGMTSKQWTRENFKGKM